MAYTVSIADIKVYLGSCGKEQIVGIPTQANACLVERALEHKYAGQQFHVNSTYAQILRAGEDEWEPAFDLTPEIQVVVEEFDRFTTPPTRAQVEAAIPVLKGEN